MQRKLFLCSLTRLLLKGDTFAGDGILCGEIGVVSSRMFL